MENVQAMLIPVRQLLLQPCYSYIMHNAFSSVPLLHVRSINMSLNTPTPLYHPYPPKIFIILLSPRSCSSIGRSGDRPILCRFLSRKDPELVDPYSFDKELRLYLKTTSAHRFNVTGR